MLSSKTFTDALAAAVTSPNVEKAKTLKDIFSLFKLKSDIVAGSYGNKNSDTEAYTEAGVPDDKIWIVNSEGVLKSARDGAKSSYGEHALKVDSMYPLVMKTRVPCTP